jgi:Fic family protein
MAYDPEQPYNDLPLLPPPGELETKAVLKQCLAANKAVAELKGVGDLIPNQAMLINAIPLQEAKLSSEIENIVTTQDNLYRAVVASGATVDAATKEVLQYREALRHGFDQLRTRPMSIHLLVEVCGVLRKEKVEIRDQEPIVIGNRAAGKVIYTPPRGRSVLKKKLTNLESFLVSQSELDPLIKMAVAHYQFEAIHPFDDGNGRTGRILNILYLIHEKLLSIPVLYLSRFIIQNKAEYYNRLRAVTETDEWEEWLVYMLGGVEETARWTTNRVHTIRKLFEDTVAHCKRDLPGIYSKELVETIFAQPYCKIQFLIDDGIAKRDAAGMYLKELERVGILHSEKVGREVIYTNPALLSVLKA